MNWKTLSEEEVSVLAEEYRLTIENSQEQRGSTSVENLLDVPLCLSYIDELTTVLQSPSHLVTASQFSKRYGFLVTAPSLYAMTIFNKGLDLSISNTHVESFSRDDVWLPKLRLNRMDVSRPNESYEEWRDQIISRIFGENLAPVWRSVSQAAKIPKAILWENTALYVYWLYEKKIGKEADPRGDLYYLIHDAPARLFGESENPLKKFYPRAENPVRKTCCLYYELNMPPQYCNSCPKAVNGSMKKNLYLL